MEERPRFSAALVNFDRFISLNQPSSRSLSPDRELHQMLRPYQRHRATTTSSATHASNAARRSTDMIPTGSGAGALLEGASTQAATSPSRSVSGGAATTSCASSAEASRHGVPRTNQPYYTVIDEEDETASLRSSPPFAHEEVDPLLRAVQQLGSPLFNPVTQRFLCWKLHGLERRTRASYGDIEGVSCDFCGDTDWLDESTDAQGGSSLQGVKKEYEADTGAPSPSLPAHSRFLYHCPVCAVDICCGCLAEVREDERFHVPCLQCRRCGAYETRRDAPLHRCRFTHAKEEKKAEKEAKTARVCQSPPPVPVVVPQTSVKDPLPIKEEEEVVAVVAPPSAAVSRPLAGVTVRSQVRLGLSRRNGGGPATVERTAFLSEEPIFAPTTITTTTAAAAVGNGGGATRKRFYTARGASEGLTARRKPEEGEDGAPADETPQRKRQGAMPSRVSQARSVERSGDAPHAHAHTHNYVPANARYEVHLRPQSAEEVDEVRRIAREQHLVLLPAAAVARKSVAYFPTRLAAETCVDRAAAGSVDALLKRHVRDD